MKTFKGYIRPDGNVGVRNMVAVIPSVFCANRAAELIAEGYPEAAVMTHALGCGQYGDDIELSTNMLIALGKHPNVAAIVVVGLGCERISPERLYREIALSGKPTCLVHIQNDGGMKRTVEKGRAFIDSIIEGIRSEKRVEVPIKKLVLGLKCGGTDATSGIAANPTLGCVTDKLIAEGGTAFLSEITELIGAEHILAARAVNDKVKDVLYKVIDKWEKELLRKTKDRTRTDVQGQLVSTGNFAGGVSSVAEKALGGVYKAGSCPVSGVLEYGEKPLGNGLYVMDAPGVDNEVVTALVCGGAQVVVFTSGRGTPTGFPFVPVIKMTGNNEMYEALPDVFDLSVGNIMEGKSTPEKESVGLFDEVIAVANGKKTLAETFRNGDLFSIMRLNH